MGSLRGEGGGETDDLTDRGSAVTLGGINLWGPPPGQWSGPKRVERKESQGDKSGHLSPPPLTPTP